MYLLLRGMPTFQSEIGMEAQNASIVGTWVSEKDSNSKWVFTQTDCKRYYDNELLFTFSYSTSNSSPQCGHTVPIDRYTSYLKLTENIDGKDYCYEINGITNQKLSLRAVGRGRAMVFNKQ